MRKNQKGFTLVELLAVIVILAVIILIAVNAVLPQMQKARRKSFADEGLSFAKAAENAYVDQQKSTDACFTVAQLKNGYVSKSDSSYKGKIVIDTDDNGNITSKTIYLANGDWMIVEKTSDHLGSNQDTDVVAYASSGTGAWSSSYESCPTEGD